jgi:hypothetical protein
MMTLQEFRQYQYAMQRCFMDARVKPGHDAECVARRCSLILTMTPV